MRHAPTAVVTAALLLAGCARVFVPPSFDLKPHEALGLIDVKCPSAGDLADVVTQKLLESAAEEQIGIQVVEIGDERTALSAVARTELGPETYQALGDKYGIKSIFLGQLTVSDVKPSIFIGPGLDFASLSATVSATLAVRLVQTTNGATIWSKSASSEQTVAGVSKFGSSFSFQAEDPDEAYGELARRLARQVTRDFRHSWRFKCWGR
jgi:hypothetical protein